MRKRIKGKYFFIKIPFYIAKYKCNRQTKYLH